MVSELDCCDNPKFSYCELLHILKDNSSVKKSNLGPLMLNAQLVIIRLKQDHECFCGPAWISICLLKSCILFVKYLGPWYCTKMALYLRLVQGSQFQEKKTFVNLLHGSQATAILVLWEDSGIFLNTLQLIQLFIELICSNSSSWTPTLASLSLAQLSPSCYYFISTYLFQNFLKTMAQSIHWRTLRP